MGQLDNISLEELEEVPIIVSKSTHCFSCRFGFDDASKSVNCFQCNSYICDSIPCNINDLCKLCYNQEQMDSEREDAKRKTQKQADKMLELSRRRFGEAKVGDTVLLAIPDLDRGRCEFPNLTAIVVEVHDGGLYKLGCKTGILDSFYTRNQFSPTQESFLTLEDVNLDKVIPLRTAASEESMGGGQGFFRCTCTGKCITKRCKCFKADRKCNSRCHNRRTCNNLD